MHSSIPPQKKQSKQPLGHDHLATGFQNCGETWELEQASIFEAQGPIAVLGSREISTPRNRLGAISLKTQKQVESRNPYKAKGGASSGVALVV
ncbi:hypothetical protein AVEN_72276-1 [Araneus ventricosus]|uniref:Uncharacterized protein n=1 Tax=Araneus ventricosus TaxID=182803 RepID=A0A4Y2RBN3_ARAVE|nr:hypothetical protein AVEN_72276-1 [Araneus ventricosus]